MRSFWAHARYAFINVFQLAFIGFLLMGGPWMWAGLAIAGVFIAMDEHFEDRRDRDYASPAVLHVLLYLNLPSLLAISVVFAFYVSDTDPLGLAAMAHQLFGMDLVANREATAAWELIPAGLMIALFYGAAGINAAHELSHRTHSAMDQAVARWMLAPTCDTTFPIEHIYGHHKHVGTDRDPATARRGEYILSFMLRSTIGCFANAFALERARLAAMGKRNWSLSNRALRGQLMSLAFFAGVFWLSGWVGVVVFLALAINGKMYLEAVNYIEHYGLVRVPGTRITARHSWDCYQAISTTFLYNLTRHADHHIHTRKSFWDTSVDPGAVRMPHGYMLMIFATFVPPVWRRVTKPGLDHWDRHMASDKERRLVASKGWLLSDPTFAAAE